MAQLPIGYRFPTRCARDTPDRRLPARPLRAVSVPDVDSSPSYYKYGKSPQEASYGALGYFMATDLLHLLAPPRGTVLITNGSHLN